MKKSIWAIVFIGLLAGAAEFRIEAESISEQGDWKVGGQGPQSIERKLLFSVNGKPDGSQNAISGTYNCPAAGKYYVWVRAENRGDGYRKTDVRINGKSIGKFGDDGSKGQEPALGWKRTLGAVNLPQGEFKLDLIPLSKYSRIDSLVFTTDQSFKPSDDPREIEEIDALDCE